MDRKSYQKAPTAFARRLRRWRGRVFLALRVVIPIYLASAAIGLIPRNADFLPDPNGIEIGFTSTATHADIVLPIANDIVNWRQDFLPDYFTGDTRDANWVTIGWGDRAYFARTRPEPRALTAIRAAFWPTPSCVLVYLTREARSQRSVKLSPGQYRRLAEYVRRSLRRNPDGTLQPIPGSNYGDRDAFFEAVGDYSAVNTCNNWVGRAMQVAGIRVGWFTPLPKTMFLYLASDSSA